MSHTVSWLEPNRLIMVELAGEIDLEETKAFDAAIIQYLEIGSATVHLILDFTKVTKVPLHPKEIVAAQQFMQHPKLGWGLIVGSNRFIRFISVIIFQLVRIKFRQLETLDDAILFIYKTDDTLKENNE